MHHFLPGVKSGGPIRTIANLVESLSDDYHFGIATADRDAGDSKAYDGVRVNSWNSVGSADVIYLGPDKQTVWSMRDIVSTFKPDIVYLNSFFDFRFTFYALLSVRLVGRDKIPIVIAPRGEFARAALSIKSKKKQAFIKTATIAGLYHNLIWQASSTLEQADINREFGKVAKEVLVAPDLPALDYLRFVELVDAV